MASVPFKQRAYCIEKMVAGKRTYVPFELQRDNILVPCRSYQSQQANVKYMRRITWFQKDVDNLYQLVHEELNYYYQSHLTLYEYTNTHL